MKKHLFTLLSVIAVLILAFSGCKKEVDPADTPTDSSDNTTSKIVATIYDTPKVLSQKGSIDIAGHTLWFAMEWESYAYHTPYAGVAVLATPKPENSLPYVLDYDNSIVLNEGDEIGPEGYYSQNDTCCFINMAMHNAIGYSGFSFQEGGKTHYGWVKYEFNTVMRRAKIYGYAYESVAGKSIRAGATE